MAKRLLATIALSEYCGPESLNHKHTTLEDRLSEAAQYLEEAKRIGCDFVCLPESFAHHEWAEHTMHEYAEELGNGPVSSFLSEWSKKGNMNVVCATPILFNGKPYNAAVLFDRTGLNVSEITDQLRERRGSASRTIVRERLQSLVADGIVNVADGPHGVSIYSISEEVADRWYRMLGLRR